MELPLVKTSPLASAPLQGHKRLQAGPEQVPAEEKKSPLVRKEQNKPSRSNETNNKSFTSHITEVARQVREALQKAGIRIEFNVNREQNRVVIVVKDPATGQVVRQIPPEEAQRIEQQLRKLKQDHQNQGIELDVRF